ncbi:hypothetical protein [Granulicella rosea]|uniref:hypothetical protein n=1 Tax=Granulicella rosea TaxID=474952 RepID=UPI000B781DAC|nr:hypothetical protein [Granulicella rosea]
MTVLVAALKDVVPDDPRTFITYSQAHVRLGIRVIMGHPGRSLQEQGLNSLAQWAHESDVPAITGLIVRDAERDPGQGYFKLYGKRELSDIPWWLGEIRRSKGFDWSSYLQETQPEIESKKRIPPAPPITVASLAQPDSRFFLKSEYGPLSTDWPVVAFSSRSVGDRIQANFRPDRDFIVYTGTGDKKTADPSHRSRLLSIMRIDTTQIQATSELIPEESWAWASGRYPGQWENCFRADAGWNFLSLPYSRETLPVTYPKIGLHRGDVLEITSPELGGLLNQRLVPLVLQPVKEQQDASPATTLPPDLLSEARRIASLIFARVSISGETVSRTAPERTAPDDLVPNIHHLLQADPLLCYLCGGAMQIRPTNRLFQPSPDRIDSALGDYGPDNLRLAHLACNLGKNAASVDEFQESLEMMRQLPQ